MIVVSYRERACTDCQVFKNIARGFYRRVFKSGRVASDSICKQCRRERARANYLRIRADPELDARRRERAAQRRRERYTNDPEHREHEKRRHREWLAAKRGAERTRMLQDARIRAAITRETSAARPPSRNPKVPGAYTKPSGPLEQRDATPLRAWLTRTFPDMTTGEIAQRCHVSDRVIYAIMVERKATVSIVRADHILTGAGRPDVLNALYPLPDEYGD